MRLRTLPLSLSGVVLGTMLAAADFHINPWGVVFLFLTTVSLQILSNLSNELGDTLSGTDGPDREGPMYSLQGGGMTVRGLKGLIALFIVLSCVFGLAMLRASFGTLWCLDSICFMLLGAGAIWAAMRYTLGKNPYGYRGLGDVYVFVFFGLVTVLGAYLIGAHTLKNWQLLLPACTIGCFSVGVLNVNNIRDMESDARTRQTVAIRLGERYAKIYQTVLIVLGWACMVTYCLLRFPDPWHWLFVLTLPLYVLHLRGVWRRSGRELDPMLPLLVLSTFAFALLGGLGFLVYLW